MAIESVEPEVVYHYTTMDTMLKIVQSKTIWASSMAYLNDTSEGQYFINQVRIRLPEFSKQRGYGSEFITEMSNDANKETPFQLRPYVASFSREDDSLPQWRSYCEHGNGVAIGFSVDCLKRVYFAEDNEIREIAVGFRDVKYTEKQLPDEVLDQEIIDTIEAADAVIQIAKGAESSSSLAREKVFRVLIEAHASYRKHLSFSHEREFRIVVNPIFVHPTPPLDFRPVRTTLIPYMKLRIPITRKDSEHLQFEPPSVVSLLSGRKRFQFIERVVIGPTPNMPLSLQAVHEYFNKMQMDVEVKPSDAPFREW
jgi:hypothetical protein